jgi:arylformamidase
MSESDVFVVRGTSAAADPHVAFADSLWQAVGALMKAGGTPGTMRAMTWTAPEPAVLSPRRRDIDRLYREALGGARPAVTLRAGEEIAVEIAATKAAAPNPTPVWHGLSRAELAREYSPRNQVPDMRPLFQQWTREGLAWRANHAAIDIAYGKLPDETFDLYVPKGKKRRPVWMFIHGGYWQATGKEQHAQFMQGMLAAGFAVANVDYTLCPDIPLSGIVDQIGACIDFIAREADALGIDGSSIHVSGHSAGGHLSAMMAARETGAPIKSALLLSGLFEMEPFPFLPMGPIIGVTTPAHVAALSPIRFKSRAAKIGVALGDLESAEFKWQSDEIAKAWHTPAPLHLAGAHHFSLLDGLNAGPLLDLAIATASV